MTRGVPPPPRVPDCKAPEKRTSKRARKPASSTLQFYVQNSRRYLQNMFVDMAISCGPEVLKGEC